MAEVVKRYIEYNDIHRLCASASAKIKESGFAPEVIIAIGGGGYIPARILRMLNMLFISDYQ
jgi:hypoxanthine phosphoribosyltransferase